MLNLEKFSGLPIQMRDDFSLVFENGLPAVTPAVREFPSMKSYLKDPGATYWRRDVYHMYRMVARSEDADSIKNAGIEYDITVIPPGKIGDEFVKTIGHYHSFEPGTAARYPEVYEVIYGKAIWVLQSATPDLETLNDVYVVTAERGQKIIVPPGYGHVSVNPGGDVLILSNWQPLANKSDYMPYEKNNGAAYYIVESQRLGSAGKTSVESKFVPNMAYKTLPKVIEARPRELAQYELRSALPAYFTGVRDLSKLDFLVHPSKYLDELTAQKLFVI